jgi:hypothetical protein
VVSFLLVSHQNPVCIPLLPILATCPSHLVLLDVIILIILDEEYGLDRRGSIPDKPRCFSLLHSVQTSSGAHPASYTMGTGGPFPGWGGGKAVGA